MIIMAIIVITVMTLASIIIATIMIKLKRIKE
jgi:hypothetical protein